MKLKTLKDLETTWLMSTKEKGKGWKFVNVLLLRQFAIKWIKEDLRLIKKNPLLRIEKAIANKFIERWCFRLNITEGGLD